MNEADLLKIRTALEEDNLLEACNKMEATLKELGWKEEEVCQSSQ